MKWDRVAAALAVCVCMIVVVDWVGLGAGVKRGEGGRDAGNKRVYIASTGLSRAQSRTISSKVRKGTPARCRASRHSRPVDYSNGVPSL